MNDLMRKLAEPFPADRVGWKAQATKGERALAVAYIDARDVMDRLDAVVGPENWTDAYTIQPEGNVLCRLSLRVGPENGWVAKEDVGGESDQSDAGDKCKAAFSDALKRAAVKWGVGRYLYRLDAVWCDYDPQKKQLRGTPRLPDWALPRTDAPAKAPPKKANGHTAPADAAEFQQRVCARDAVLAARGACQPGELVAAVVAAGKPHGYPDDLGSWPPAGFELAAKVVSAFVKGRAAAASAGASA